MLTKHAIAAVLLLPLAAHAQNLDGGIGLRKSDAVALKKEVLGVSRALISVEDEFVNESGTDVEETMVLRLPAFPVAGRIRFAFHDDLIGFLNQVDGKPVPYQTVVRAFVDGTDVTPQLRKLGLSELQMTYQSAIKDGAVAPLLSTRQREQLERLKLFGTRENGEAGPLWKAQISYTWRQKFPANKTVRTYHAYQPFFGNSLLDDAASMDQDTAQRFCADQAFLKSWKRLATQAAPDSMPFLVAQTAAYPLERGNRWKNGIEDFTLNLVKIESSELISLCVPGTVKKRDAKTFQVHLRDFHPASGLDVYFGNFKSRVYYKKESATAAGR